MNLNTSNDACHGLYDCFSRAADALFNTADALLAETTAQSFAELALSPFFQRQRSSLYEAFEEGDQAYASATVFSGHSREHTPPIERRTAMCHSIACSGASTREEKGVGENDESLLVRGNLA